MRKLSRIGTIAAILFLLARAAAAAEPEVRFLTVDVVIDAGADALAAYQVEITADGDASILSVEGGEHPAFNPPPFFDEAALGGGRIRLAAFSTRADLPSGRTRVATLHVRESGAVTYRARLLAAARADGSRFSPPVSTVAGGH